jgi:predicted Rossmann-fold nucleotide-binding protein
MAQVIISVFGSAYPTEDSPAYEQARKVGRMIAEAGWIICNGGYGGAMEASARGAYEAGGKSVGVTGRFYRSSPTGISGGRLSIPSIRRCSTRGKANG